MDELQPERLPDLSSTTLPGPSFQMEEPTMSATLQEGWTLHQHGLAKGAMMLLGLAHHHDGDDIVVSAGWESLLEALGFSSEGTAPLRQKNALKVVEDRLASLRKAKHVLDEERSESPSWKRNGPPSASPQKREHGSVVWASQKPTVLAGKRLPPCRMKALQTRLPILQHSD